MAREVNSHTSRRRAKRIGRRQALAFLGAVGAWPVAALGQQRKLMRRIGLLMGRAADDPAGQVVVAAFMQGLQERGWAIGRNVSIDIRWGAGDPDRYRAYAAELVALDPDVILAPTTTPVRALLQVTRGVPIVFAAATDPVGGGLVASLAHPGGNVTGFLARELGFSAKWLELLKEVAPRLERVAVLRDSTTTGGVGQFAAIQTAAPAFRVELTPIDLRDASEIERAVRAFARQPNGGMIMISASRADLHRKLIIALAAQHQLPAIYPLRLHVAEGGLMSYGADQVELYRLAASYVDRILKGEKPADLPVRRQPSTNW